MDLKLRYFKSIALKFKFKYPKMQLKGFFSIITWCVLVRDYTHSVKYLSIWRVLDIFINNNNNNKKEEREKDQI